MEGISFFKYLGIMSTVFEAVSSAASSPMVTDAINVTPTEEERAQLQASFGEIATHIHQLKEEAQEKIAEYTARKEESAIASEASIKEYTRMQENLSRLMKENTDAKAALVQKRVEKDHYESACKQSERELDDLTRRRDREVAKARKNKEDLKKWFWVPGYGLYLAIDTLVKELNNDIESLTRRRDEERRRWDNLTELYSRTSQEVEERSRQIEMVKIRIQDQTRQMEQQNAVIDMYKKQLVYWEDFYKQICQLESKLKASEGNPNILYEVVEVMEVFKEVVEDS